MIDRIMALFAIVILACFLGILIWFVPRWDLGAVLAITMVLVLWDFITSAGRRNGR